MKHFESTEERSVDYYRRLKEVVKKEDSFAKKIIRLNSFIDSAENHFQRLQYAKRRYQRAFIEGDRVSELYEHDVMLALLYEIADTIYMTIAAFDVEEFSLKAAEDGVGMVGDRAADIVYLFDKLNRQSQRLLDLESDLGLCLDFSKSVCECQGITFTKNAHWEGFSTDSNSDMCFVEYFAARQKEVRARLTYKIPFLNNRTLAQQLERKGRYALLEVLRRLDAVTFSRLQVEFCASKDESTTSFFPFHMKNPFSSWTSRTH